MSVVKYNNYWNWVKENPKEYKTAQINGWLPEIKKQLGYVGGVNHNKGRNLTSHYLDFNFAKTTAIDLINNGSTREIRIGLFVMVGIYTGMKVKDILSLTYEQLRDNNSLNVNGYDIVINENIKTLMETYPDKTGPVFKSQKSNKISIQVINKGIKEFFGGLTIKVNLSTGSTRKTYGREIYRINNDSAESLIYLSKFLGYPDMESLSNYLSLDIKKYNINLCIS